MCKISRDEIVVLGGVYRDPELSKPKDEGLQDVFLFNTKSNKLEKVIFDHTQIKYLSESKFSTDDGICQSGPGQFVVLRNDMDDFQYHIGFTVVKSKKPNQED